MVLCVGNGLQPSPAYRDTENNKSERGALRKQSASLLWSDLSAPELPFCCFSQLPTQGQAPHTIRRKLPERIYKEDWLLVLASNASLWWRPKTSLFNYGSPSDLHFSFPPTSHLWGIHQTWAKSLSPTHNSSLSKLHSLFLPNTLNRNA